METDFLLDAGAYTTLSPVVLSRGAIHALGPYRCPNVRIRARAVATHTPPNGAFRGFGAPQSLFAIERHMDIAAARMGLDPVQLRRVNLLRLGDLMATGQRVDRGPGPGGPHGPGPGRPGLPGEAGRPSPSTTPAPAR